MEFTDQDYELLSAYLDGDLSPGDRAVLEARLVAEPGLQRELAALRQTVQLVNSLPQLKAPRDFVLTPAMVSNKVIPFPAQPRSRMLKLVLPVLSAAASLLVILIGLGALLSSQAPQSSSVNPTQQVAGFSSPTAMLTVDATLTLDDLPEDQAQVGASADLEETAADAVIQPEADDQTALLMVVPSESPTLVDGEMDMSSGGAAVGGVAKTTATIIAPPMQQATLLPQASLLPATALYYESAPAIVASQALTEVALPGSLDTFAASTMTDAAASEAWNEAETQAKMLTETPVTEELSSASAVEDTSPTGNARLDRSVAEPELFTVDLSIWITIVVMLIRSLF